MVIDFLTTPLVDRSTESDVSSSTIEMLPTAEPVKFDDSVRGPTPVGLVAGIMMLSAI
jgi:hypothetical protein